MRHIIAKNVYMSSDAYVSAIPLDSSPRNAIIKWQNMYIFNSSENTKGFLTKILVVYILRRSVLVSIAVAKAWPQTFPGAIPLHVQWYTSSGFTVWFQWFEHLSPTWSFRYSVLWSAYSRLLHYPIGLSYIDILGFIKYG